MSHYKKQETTTKETTIKRKRNIHRNLSIQKKSKFNSLTTLFMSRLWSAATSVARLVHSTLHRSK